MSLLTTHRFFRFFFVVVIFGFAGSNTVALAGNGAYTTSCAIGDINENLCNVMAERVQALDDDLNWVVYSLGFVIGTIVTLYCFNLLRRSVFGKVATE